MRLRVLITLAAVFTTPPLRSQTPEVPRSSAGPLAAFSQSLESLAGRVGPAVVQIVSTGYGRGETAEQGASSVLTRQRSTGSGILLSEDGFIVTNYHVVQGARRIEVRLPAGESGIPQEPVMPARLVGMDRQTDVAVIKIERTGLPHLSFGDPKEVHVGQVVMAFGSPLGLAGSVSMGVVSSTSRLVHEDDSIAYLQTDAPINPGNSGGPLVDTNGQVVGINTFILTQSGGSEGLGFAIPSDVVESVYKQIRKYGHVHRGQLGIVAQDITPEMVKVLKLPQGSGAIAADVLPGGPADQAGMQIEDIIVKVNGSPIKSARDLQSFIYGQALDNEVAMTVRRGDQTLALKMKVIERADDPQRFADMVDPEKNVIPQLGILVVELNEKTKDLLSGLRHTYGLVIAAEVSDTPYSGESLKVGDVIYEVNHVPAVTIRAVTSTLAALKSGDPAVIQVERDGRLMYVTLELE
jgi:serine protease Do